MAEVLDTISCLECGAHVHAIKVHLNKDARHAAEGGLPLTYEEYRAKYPDAPLLSTKAIEEVQKRRALKATSPKAEVVNAKAAFAELFSLQGIPSAKRADGQDIMVSICQQEGSEEFVPRYNPNYVYNIDNLKSVLMAFEIGLPVYNFGHSGVGKTTLYKQICAATRRRMVRMQHTVNTQESDIVGQWVVAKEVHGDQVINVTKYQLGPLPTAMLNGWVYCADEYDRAPPSVCSVYNAILEGNGEPLHIPDAPPEYRHIIPHPEFRFCATGNTNGSGDDTGLYQATMQQDAATIERFAIVINSEYMPAPQETAVIRGAAKIKQTDAERLVKFAASCREKFPLELSLTVGTRVLINIAMTSMLKGSLVKGVELCFANRLPADERKAVLDLAQRHFGDDGLSV